MHIRMKARAAATTIGGGVGGGGGKTTSESGSGPSSEGADSDSNQKATRDRRQRGRLLRLGWDRVNSNKAPPGRSSVASATLTLLVAAFLSLVVLSSLSKQSNELKRIYHAIVAIEATVVRGVGGGATAASAAVGGGSGSGGDRLHRPKHQGLLPLTALSNASSEVPLPTSSGKNETRVAGAVAALRLGEGRKSSEDNGEEKDEGAREYPFELPTGKRGFTSDGSLTLPIPVQAVERYIQWHSVDALRRDFRNGNDGDLRRRTFAIGMYQCPAAAGNRLHEFMNAFLFSVITNRTLLWKYYDLETCVDHRQMLEALQVNGKTPLKRCELTNSVHDCNAMLKRKSWIPAFDEWSTKLELPRPVYLTKNEMRGMEPATGGSGGGLLGDNRTVVIFHHTSTSLPLESAMKALFAVPSVDDGQGLGTNSITSSSNGGNIAASATQALRDLYSLGVEYFYGMAFRYLFRFSDRIMQSVPEEYRGRDGTESNPSSAADVFTVALHSRHTDDKDDGCDVDKELNCLRQILSDRRQQMLPCRVLAMADRECTLASLRSALEQPATENTPSILLPPLSAGGNGTDSKNNDLQAPVCTIEIAQHEVDKGIHDEHGPFAGAGYFQDLAFTTSGARHGLVAGRTWSGGLRSSSAFVHELIEFNRRMEAWRVGQDIKNVPNLTVCTFLSKNAPTPRKDWKNRERNKQKAK